MISIREGYDQDRNVGGKSISAARGSRSIVHSLCFVRHNARVLLDGVESRIYKLGSMDGELAPSMTNIRHILGCHIHTVLLHG